MNQLAFNFDIGAGFSNAWTKVAQFIPQFIGFLAVLVIGWIVATVIRRVLDKVLHKVGFEKLCERAGISRMLSNSKYDGTGIVCTVVFAFIMLMVLQLAFGVFGTNPISTMLNTIITWIPRGIVALVIVIVAMAIANAVRNIVGGALSATSYGKVLATVAWAAIVALGAIAALTQAGIANSVVQPLLYTGLICVAGVVVVGVGGGLILPMRQRWERWLDTAERETANARDSIGAYQAGRSDAASAAPDRRTESAGGASRTDEGGDDRRL